MRISTWILIIILLSACVPQRTPRSPTLPFDLRTTATEAPLFVATVLPSFAPSPMVSLTVSPTITSTTAIASICSPIAGFNRSELEAAISNPFHPPKRAGSDDPHQAIDLAVTESGISLDGVPVNLLLGGRVAAVISDRFPYGNALLVETSLDDMPDEWEGQIDVPTPAPTLGPHPSLTCPKMDIPNSWDFTQRSLYLLYAHLADTPLHQLDEIVSCGEQIGEIGMSGNALNPHLHLEARVGPRMASFESIAHYETRAAPEEMWAYCTWRVSGIFQLLDPINLLNLVSDGD